jgi:uncharacterized damage-inducible protein DinB
MSTRSFYLNLLTDEYPRFRKVIEAVPAAKLDWQPEPKARTARQLIGHLIGHNQDLVELCCDAVIHHRNQVPFQTVPEALELYDQSYDDLKAQLAGMDDAAWDKPAEFFVGDHLIMAAPTQQVSWMLLLDSIHHRGQLSTYLRPMGSKVPALYGPSADDQGEVH